MLALRGPAAPGVNFTEMVQVAPAVRVAGAIGHVFVCEKSPAFAPVSETRSIVSGAVPLFVNVVIWAALVVPTGWEPKLRLEGVSVTAGAASARRRRATPSAGCRPRRHRSPLSPTVPPRRSA